MRFTAKVVESARKVTANISKALQTQVQSVFRKAKPKIQRDISKLIADAIRAEPEYGALKAGKLRLEIGIADTSVVDDVVDLFAQSIKFNINQVKVGTKGIDAVLSFTIIGSDDFENILQSNAAVITSENGAMLPWLTWLLLKGGDEIVLNNKVLFKPSPASRTGQAIMIPTKGGGWRVPARYIGTESNNWVTRAMSKIEPDILNAMKKHVERG
tara:strand:+ start:1170 stop:1811 length:642 start_codon:yes stop_codon:yes gene_type:complete